MSGAVVEQVERRGVGSKPTLCKSGEWEFAGSQQDVGVVGHERPSVKTGTRFAYQAAEPLEEPPAIAVGMEDLASFDSAADHMMEGIRIVEPGSTRHASADNMI